MPRALVAYGLFICAAVAMWLAVGHTYAWLSVRRELKAWRDAGQSMEELRAQYPAQPASPEAIELARRVDVLGIHLADRGSHAVDDRPLYDAKVAYLRDLQAQGNDRVPEMPQHVRSRLRSQGAALGEIARYLVAHGPAVRWESAIEEGFDAPFPNLLANRALHSSLVLMALDQSQAGQDDEARRLLRAAASLRESLARHPGMLGELIVIALATEEFTVLRVVPANVSEWIPLLAQMHFAESMIDVLRFEAFTDLHVAREYRAVFDIGGSPPAHVFSGGPVRGAFRILLVPYTQMGLADASRQIRETQAWLREPKSCDVRGEDLDAHWMRLNPRWNVIGKTMVATSRGWLGARGADLDAELTKLVLEMRAPGAPLARSGLPSSVCTDVTWTSTRQPSGRLEIRPAPEPAWDGGRQWTFTMSGGR